MATVEQQKAAIAITKAVADTIRELKETPESHLYVILMATGTTREDFQAIISVLIRVGFVKRTPSHLLVWTGP